MRRLIATLSIGAITSSLLVSPGQAMAPNPCTIIPAATITAVFGTAPGKLSTESAGQALKLTLCVYQRGKSKLQIGVGPAVIANSGSGGPATVSRPDPAFGPRGHLAYGLTPPYIYATVFFTKGAYYGTVWSNAVTAQGVITLANALYKSL